MFKGPTVPERGDVIEGVGVLVDCPTCESAGWVRHPSAPGSRAVCPRCAGRRFLIEDGTEPEPHDSEEKNS